MPRVFRFEVAIGLTINDIYDTVFWLPDVYQEAIFLHEIPGKQTND